MVGEDISQILGVAVRHAHGSDSNWDFVVVFGTSKVEVPKAGRESVGANSAEDFLRLGPSGGRLSGRRLVL